MKTRNITIGLIILCMVSCVPKRTENEGSLVRINGYNPNKEIYVTDTLYLHKEIKNDTLNFIYKKGGDTIISLCKPNNNDFLIFVNNDKCELTDNKTFVINGRKYIVSTYFDGVRNDAEFNVFYHSEYGILGIFKGFSFRGTLISSWEYDRISKVLIDSIISNLYNFHYLPPPPEFKDSILLKMKRKKTHNKNANVVGQTQYITHATLKNNLKNYTLVDSISGTMFVLDSTQIYVTAIDKGGKELWRTDPWKDNKLEEYRVKRPKIILFNFANNKWTDNKEVIWIVYNNTQFGILDKSNGKFTWFGQD